MIRYALICEEGHGFEAWFGSADTYDEQAEAHAILCPACGSAQVNKAPMAPYVAKRRAETPSPPSAERPKSYAMLRKLRAEVRELRRANEILKSASAFFAAELDRPQPR